MVLLNLPNAMTFNTVPHAVATATLELFPLILHNCKFATVMNCHVNISVSHGLRRPPWKGPRPTG